MPASESVFHLHRKFHDVVQQRPQDGGAMLQGIPAAFLTLVDRLRCAIPLRADRVRILSPEPLEMELQRHRESLSRKQSSIRQRAAEMPPKSSVADVEEAIDGLVRDRDRCRADLWRKVQEIRCDFVQGAGLVSRSVAQANDDLGQRAVGRIRQRIQRLEQMQRELQSAISECASSRSDIGPRLGSQRHVFGCATDPENGQWEQEALHSGRRSVWIHGSHLEVHWQSPTAEGLEVCPGIHLQKVVDAYDSWVKHCSNEAIANATDEALKAVQLALRTCDCFALPPRRDIPCETLDGMESLRRLMVEADGAMEAELRHRREFDPVALFPAEVLLRGSQKELAAYRQEIAFLTQTCEPHLERWEKEIAALKPGVDAQRRDGPLKALADSREALLDAQEEFDDAKAALRRAERRGRPTEDLVETLETAKRTVRQRQSALTDATKAVAQIEAEFPEVVGYMGLSIPQAILHLWKADRRLDHFDDRQPLGTHSRNVVYKAALGTEQFAIKCYPVSEGGLKICLQEAGRLVRAAHPHVVEVVAVFHDCDHHFFCLQMPYYDEGPIDQWLAARRPDAVSVRRALLQLFEAVAHLHGIGIIHSDLKPSNVLVCAKGRVRLADFDVAVDLAVWTSVTHICTTTQRVGFSRGFAAPELLHTGATTASDMYSLGAVLRCLGEVLEGLGLVGLEEDGARLADRLCSDEPAPRPRAAAALEDPFFAPVFAWQSAAERECCVMSSEQCEFGARPCALAQGVECGSAAGEAHFVCDACFVECVRAFLKEDVRVQQLREGRMHCPKFPSECEGCAFADDRVAGHVPSDLFQDYLKVRIRMMEQRLVEAHEKRFQEMVAAELEKLRRMDGQQRKTGEARKHLVEKVLTAHCPRCGQAYLDFDGCCALKCSRCPCAFCAWCGADCGSDAHAHVARCRERPQGVDGLFPRPWEAFSAHRRQRCQRLARAYLDQLPAAIRQCVCQELHAELRELGVA